MVMSLYDQQLAHLPFECDNCILHTCFGETHVLMAGPETAPPLVVLHGFDMPAPYILEMIQPIIREYRVYAPDVIGQVGRSDTTYIPPRDNNYGRWLLEVIDALQLKRVPFIGVSFGSAIVMDLAVIASERITRAAFVVPAGIVKRVIKPFYKLILPWYLYKLCPSPKRLHAAIRPIMAGAEEGLLSLFEGVIRYSRHLVRFPPGPFNREKLSNFDAPVLVLGVKDDIFFPADAVVSRSREIFPSLVAAELFEGTHIPASAVRMKMNYRILGFLKENR